MKFRIVSAIDSVVWYESTCYKACVKKLNELLTKYPDEELFIEEF